MARTEISRRDGVLESAASTTERQDVRAHLIGGVPVSEVEAWSTELRAVGLDLATLFVPATEPSQLSLFDQRPEPLVDEAYLAFRQELVDRRDLAPAVTGDAGVRARRAALTEAGAQWWAGHAADPISRAASQPVGRLRKGWVEGLVTAVVPVGLFDEPEARAVGEAWWDAIEPDVRTLRAQGSFLAVVVGWGGNGDMSPEVCIPDESDARAKVQARWGERLLDVLDRRAAGRLDGVIVLVEHWWDKYRTSLRTLEIRRSEAKARLDALVRDLGYV